MPDYDAAATANLSQVLERAGWTLRGKASRTGGQYAARELSAGEVGFFLVDAAHAIAGLVQAHDSGDRDPKVLDALAMLSSLTRTRTRKNPSRDDEPDNLVLPSLAALTAGAQAAEAGFPPTARDVDF